VIEILVLISKLCEEKSKVQLKNKRQKHSLKLKLEAILNLKSQNQMPSYDISLWVSQNFTKK